MTKLRLSIALFLLVISSTASNMQSKRVVSKAGQPEAISVAKPSGTSNEALIDALVAAPTLYVNYVEDGSADQSVLAIYPDLNGKATNPIAREVKDIVALGSRAIPLLIAHLDDNRSTVATTSGGGYLTDKPVKVPVGFICLDILLHIAGDKAPIYDEEDHHGFQGPVKDNFYFRPDDYTRTDDRFEERPIVRIVKKNWEGAYRKGLIKYNYVVQW